MPYVVIIVPTPNRNRCFFFFFFLIIIKRREKDRKEESQIEAVMGMARGKEGKEGRFQQTLTEHRIPLLNAEPRFFFWFFLFPLLCHDHDY